VAVLEELVRQAKEGDLQAIKLLLDRTLPPLRAVDAPVRVPVSGTLSEQGNAVIEQLLGGRVTPSEGSAMLGALASQARLVEVDELVKRVETLEHTREWQQ
jgi:hypothetical protein